MEQALYLSVLADGKNIMDNIVMDLISSFDVPPLEKKSTNRLNFLIVLPMQQVFYLLGLTWMQN